MTDTSPRLSHGFRWSDSLNGGRIPPAQPWHPPTTPRAKPWLPAEQHRRAGQLRIQALATAYTRRAELTRQAGTVNSDAENASPPECPISIDNTAISQRGWLARLLTWDWL